MSLAKVLVEFNFRNNFGNRTKPDVTESTMTSDQAQEVADYIDFAASPENITCDGERPRAQVRARFSMLQSAAKQLKKKFPEVKPEYDESGFFADTPDAPVINLTAGQVVNVSGVGTGTIIKVNRTKCVVELASGKYHGQFNVPKERISI